jgi:hypothetical protein
MYLTCGPCRFPHLQAIPRLVFVVMNSSKRNFGKDKRNIYYLINGCWLLAVGLSVGDFIAALDRKDCYRCTSDSGSASAEYRELLRVLYSLETGLMQVKRLEVEESQRAQLIALQQAAAQCQRTINDSWNKIKKYQPHLGSGSECSNFRMKTACTKIKWVRL